MKDRQKYEMNKAFSKLLDRFYNEFTPTLQLLYK